MVRQNDFFDLETSKVESSQREEFTGGQTPDKPLKITSTLLSQPPRTGSGLVVIISLLVLTNASLLYWNDVFQMAHQLPASGGTVFEGKEYWRLVTAVFIHSDGNHLLANGFGFALFSYLLYGYFGFWIYPAASLILGTLVNTLTLLSYSSEVRLVGASGVVYAMAGFWLISYLLIERTRSVAKRILRLTGFALVLLVPSAVEPRVSYRAHAIGFALGAFSGVLYFSYRKHRIRSWETVEDPLP